MQDITLGQLSAGLLFIVALIAGIQNLKSNIKKWIEESLKSRFDAIDKQNEKILEKIYDVDRRIDKVDMENCKNYLVTFLSDERRGEVKDPTEYQRFWEEYDHYILKGGNSYIKEGVEELKARGLLRR